MERIAGVVLVLVSLAAVGCTAENPDYVPPYWRIYIDHDAGELRIPADEPVDAAEPQRDAAMPDLSVVDLSPPADLVTPDLVVAPDLHQPPDLWFDPMCLGKTCGQGVKCDQQHGWTCCPYSNFRVNCRAVGSSCNKTPDCWPGMLSPVTCKGGICCKPKGGSCYADADCCPGTLCRDFQQGSGTCQP